MDLENYQNKLFPFAYNILGSAEDANDVVQDVMLNHIEGKKEGIENETAYLVKSVINKSINLKKRSKKMVAGTTWLPEPIATDNADKKINSQEIISYSMLVLLEYLKPRERAVFILKEAFDYSHHEIAELFSFTVENSRQLLSRAKNTLKEHNSNFNFTEGAAAGNMPEYIEAIRSGKVEQLEQLLAEQITAMTDGGGKVRVLSEFTSGIRAVANLITEVFNRYLKTYRIESTRLNHTPALLFFNGNTLVSCQLFDVDGATGKINNIYSVVDPEKLKNLNKN